MKGVKYIASSGVIKATNTLVSCYDVIVTSTAANGLAVFKTGGTGGTTVADVRSATANNTVFANLCGVQADFVNLTNAVVMIHWR